MNASILDLMYWVFLVGGLMFYIGTNGNWIGWRKMSSNRQAVYSLLCVVVPFIALVAIVYNYQVIYGSRVPILWHQVVFLIVGYSALGGYFLSLFDKYSPWRSTSFN